MSKRKRRRRGSPREMNQRFVARNKYRARLQEEQNRRQGYSDSVSMTIAPQKKVRFDGHSRYVERYKRRSERMARQGKARRRARRGF